MAHLIKDTVGGVNHYLDGQRKEPGDAYITLATFDHSYKERFAAKHLNDVQPITEDVYYGGHGGTTALLDAVGKAITSYAALPIKADKTVFIITTDGQENASQEFTQERVKELIQKYQTQGWAFVFLGANDSQWQGQTLGTQSFGGYTASANGIAAAYRNATVNSTLIRSSNLAASTSAATMDWNTIVDNDKPVSVVKG